MRIGNYRRAILVATALAVLASAGCGDSGPTALTSDQSSRRAGAVQAATQGGASVDAFDANYPEIFRIRLPRHDISTGDARALAKTAYERLGTPFTVTVYDDTDKKLAQADDAGVRD
jgi:hypothetical protein